MASTSPRLKVNEFRTVLCDATIKIIAEAGIGALTLRSLAAEVGCSRQTPYNYFRNKDELLEEVLVRCHQMFIDYCESAVEGIEDTRTKLRNLRDVAPKFHREQQDIYTVLWSASKLHPIQKVEELRAYEMMRIVSFFQEAVKQEIVQGDPVVLSIMFTNAIDTLGRFESFPEDKKIVQPQQLAYFIEQTFFPPEK